MRHDVHGLPQQGTPLGLQKVAGVQILYFSIFFKFSDIMRRSFS